MSRSLVLSFQSASAKYSRLHKKVKKSIARGEFYRYTTRKRNYLLARIEKLRKRLAELKTQIRLASVGMATAAIFSVTTADAQIPVQFGTKVGPFVKNEAKNPLPPPPFTPHLISPSISGQYTEAQYRDFDKDGDLDAIVTYGERARIYYENVGTKTNAKWKELQVGDIFQLSLPGPNYSDNAAHQAYADLDDDGDLDAIAGVVQTLTNPGTDNIFLYVNHPQENGNPYFMEFLLGEDGENNPLEGINVQGHAWPTLSDIDGDGDMDLVLGGRYYNTVHTEYAYVQVFRNNKVGHESGVFPTFTRLEDDDNPFYTANVSIDWVGVSFADLDGDGDEDFISTTNYENVIGAPEYRRNDNGVFNAQEGDWVYNGSLSTGNPFNTILDEIAVNTSYRTLTFGDLDGDGDLDATVGLADPLDVSLSATYPFRYLENKGHGVFEFADDNDNPIAGNVFGRWVSSTLFDYNGDGKKDLITVGPRYHIGSCEGSNCEQFPYVAQRIFLAENGTFSTEYIEEELPEDVPYRDTYTQMIDFDLDGDLDIIAAQDYDGSRGIYVWKNDGSGSYDQLLDDDNPFNFYNTGETGAATPVIADLDNDGIQDMILVYRSNDGEVYKNTGTNELPFYTLKEDWSNGIFGPFNDFIPSIVDMDGDGDYDLIVAKYDNDPSTQINYFQNQGDKTAPVFYQYSMGEVGKDETPVNPEFWDQNPFAFFPELGLGSFNVADIDGDGDKDLLYGDYKSGTFQFYENDNPVPIIDPGTTTITFTKGQGLNLTKDLTFSDPDNDDIAKIIVQITPYVQGKESLKYTSIDSEIGTFNAEWNDETGTLTITPEGQQDIDAWIEAAESIQYTFNGDTPANGKKSARNKGAAKIIAKTITVTTLDSDLTQGTANRVTYNVSGDDGTGGGAPPVISGSASPFYISGNLVVNASITVADPDGTIVGATIAITTGFTPSEDELVFTDQSAITGQYNAASGILTLTGNDTPGNYQAALRSVNYRNATNEPEVQDRTVVFTVDDGDNQVSTTTVVTVNKPPVITTKLKKAASGGNVAFTLSQLISDPDSNLDPGTLIITSTFGANIEKDASIVTIDYSNIATKTGDDVLTFKVCDTGGRCTTTESTVEIRADIYIFTGMSPNGDEINDWFHIDYLPEGTHVAIYNRWGDLIYEETDYNVEDPARRFEGKNKNGTEVIAGTYYYKVKYPGGSAKTGYILLNR